MNKIFLSLIILFLTAGNVFSADHKEEKNDDKTKAVSHKDQKGVQTPVYRLDPISVIEEKEGKIVLEKNTLDLLPNPMSSVTEALRSNSSVQFDSLSLDTFTGGAITPPKISIRGAHHYENNFTINGMSNNSVLNPMGFDEGEAFGGFLPSGDSQAMFISTELLESVTAYTENISAAYGDFLGGVVDARYRDAAADRWHISLGARHTRDAWTNQHYVEGNEPDDYPASQDAQHSRFKKSSFSAMVEGPVFDNLGMVLAYDRKWSKIPVYMYLQGLEEKTSSRLNENYLMRLNSKRSDRFSAALTAIYAPYCAKMYPLFQKGGNYKVKGGGFGLHLETQWKLPFALWENNLAFNRTQVSKYSNSNVGYQWISKPGGQPSSYANWTDRKFANEGMMGDWKSRQTVYELKSHLRFEELGSERLRHYLLTGLDFKLLKAKGETNGYTVYSRATADTSVTGSLADGVISGEQYTAMKFVVPANTRSQDYKTLALFAEDKIEIGRVTVRPGLRASWDSITEDFNLAPRFFVNVDVQNNDRFNVFGGYNRYYGSEILHYAINLPMANTRYSREVKAGVLEDWKKIKDWASSASQLGDLKTPYTDEFTAGASADILDTLFEITFVNRRYKDQIKTCWDYPKPKTYSNDGRTKYWGVTLEVQKNLDLGSFGQHIAELTVTRSSTKSNYAEWIEAPEDQSSAEDSAYVELNGSFVKKEELPAGNFAAPWIITYTHEMRFWDEKFRLMPTLRYETGGETLLSLRGTVTAPDGKDADRYAIVDRHNFVNIDLSAALELVHYRGNVLTLEMDITNLFDKKNVIDSDPQYPSYAMGRQLYLGLKYTF